MNEADPEDLKDIIEKAKRGDRDAFALLYTSYFAPLYRYIYFRVGSKIEAEDLTQDVFIKVYMSFNKYSYSGKSPLAYFYTIARNTIIDYRRKKKILVVGEEETLTVRDESDSPELQAIKKQDAETIRQKIACLPEDQQDVIVLKFIDDLSTKEIADMLGKNEDAIRQIQSRGLKALRKSIYE